MTPNKPRRIHTAQTGGDQCTWSSVGLGSLRIRIRLFEYPAAGEYPGSAVKFVFLFRDTRSDALPAGAGPLAPLSVMTVSSMPLGASPPSLLRSNESSSTLRRWPFGAHCSCQCSYLHWQRCKRRAQRAGPSARVAGLARVVQSALGKGTVEDAQDGITVGLAGTYPRGDVISATIAALPGPPVSTSCTNEDGLDSRLDNVMNRKSTQLFTRRTIP